MSELLFIQNIVNFLGGIINLPIQVYVDNMVALYLVEHNISNSRIYHIDIQHLFICEFVRDGVIEVIFICSENNYADILTKNVTVKIHKCHCKVYLEEDLNDED